MATVAQLMARVIDLFGPVATADPTKLYGNLMVSPNGSVLIGQTVDDGSHKLQVTGAAVVTAGLRISGGNLVFPDGSSQTTAGGGGGGTNLGLVLAMTNSNPIL